MIWCASADTRAGSGVEDVNVGSVRGDVDDVADLGVVSATDPDATIMRAARIELIAIGDRKAAAVAAMLGEVDEACPAGILQRHPDVRITLDPTAAAGLSLVRR